jgi:ribonuclease J
MINLTRPFYIAPVHGEPRHQFLYSQIARDMGYPEHRIFKMNEGIPLQFGEKDATFGTKVPCGQVLIDSSGMPGVTDEILRDRYAVAKDGVVAFTIVIDVESGKVVGDPIMQTRGFFGPEGLIDTAKSVLCDMLANLKQSELRDTVRVRHLAVDSVKRTLHKQGSIRPLVLPTVVEA